MNKISYVRISPFTRTHWKITSHPFEYPPRPGPALCVSPHLHGNLTSPSFLPFPSFLSTPFVLASASSPFLLLSLTSFLLSCLSFLFLPYSSFLPPFSLSLPPPSYFLLLPPRAIFLPSPPFPLLLPLTSHLFSCSMKYYPGPRAPPADNCAPTRNWRGLLPPRCGDFPSLTWARY